jgi:hypothetical protein
MFAALPAIGAAIGAALPAAATAATVGAGGVIGKNVGSGISNAVGGTLNAIGNFFTGGGNQQQVPSSDAQRRFIAMQQGQTFR